MVSGFLDWCFLGLIGIWGYRLFKVLWDGPFIAGGSVNWLKSHVFASSPFVSLFNFRLYYLTCSSTIFPLLAPYLFILLH